MAISDTLKWSERLALTLMKHHPEAYQIDDKTAAKMGLCAWIGINFF